MQAMVICGYPGIGKTTYVNSNPPFVCLDSDSSKFHWLYDEDGNKIGENPNFIQDYINHIKDNLYKVDVIFVSTHKAVRDALYEARIPHVICYPGIICKDDYIKRFESRGSDQKFIDFQRENYEKFISEIDSEEVNEIRSIMRFNDISALRGISTFDIINFSEFLYNEKGIDTFPYFKTFYPHLVQYIIRYK